MDVKNFISTCNHPESYLTGSTVESMINRTKELGVSYFAITDNGHLSSILKGYMYCTKENKENPDHQINLIAGIELFFKDEDCEIIQNSKSEYIKYFKILVHAKDQQAYQKLVKMVSSDTRKKVKIGEDDQYPLFNWSDLVELSKENITVSSSNLEDMVTKHLLVDRPDLGAKYFEKLLSLLGDKYYPAIVPIKYDKHWSSVVEIDFNGKIAQLPIDSMVEVNGVKIEIYSCSIKDMVKYSHRYTQMYSFTQNGVRYQVKKEYQNIRGAKFVNVFQSIGEDLQTKANKFMIELVTKHNCLDRLLINSYSYYSAREDKIVQDMKLGESDRLGHEQHIRTTEEFSVYAKEELGLDNAGIETLVNNTYRWAENFKDFKLKYEYKLPDFGPNPEKLMVEIIKKKGRMKWDDPRYVSQFKEEYNLLVNNGVINLVPYFLPIVDILEFYNKNGYLTGSSRGSVGGHLISYLMGITNIDPIKYDLSSARFLTLDRIQQKVLPDIDVDLESRIPLVGEDNCSGYLYSTYGNKAAQISTRTLLRLKSAILDANRFLHGDVQQEIAAFSKSLPAAPQGISDHDFIFGYEDIEGNHTQGLLETNEDLQKYALDRPKEWELVQRAVSLTRQHGRHASAFLISNRPLEEDIPVFEVGGVKRVTQPEHKQCEWAGLLKYDFLVISSGLDIRLAINFINKKNKEQNETGYFTHKNEKVYIWDLPSDIDVYKMLHRGETETVFQLNTVSVNPFVRAIKPTSILDCAVITSLVRPGPLSYKDPETGRNMAEEYICRRNGISKSKIQILDKLIPETYSIIVYQEQVSKIAKELGRMNAIDAENVRIAMSKKQMKLLDSLKPKFIDGATQTIDLCTAETIWNMMAAFAAYSFNKSHSVGYSVISYATAFLKYHYPLEWWAAVLTNASDKEINEVFFPYVKDLLLPPDINLSGEQIAIDYSIGKLRSKLSIITGLGEVSAQKIVSNRQYQDIQEFVNKGVCGSATTRKLIHVGILDSLFEPGINLQAKMQKFENAIHIKVYDQKIAEYDQKIIEESDEKKKAATLKRKEAYIEKGPKQGEIEPLYLSLTPIKDYMVKKSVFPTMTIDLYDIIIRYSKYKILMTPKYPMITSNTMHDYPIYPGTYLQRIDGMTLTKDMYFCVPGYVIDASEFSYQKGAKKALKLVIDSSGYVSEKVLWPDYNSGELRYPKEIKKGAVAFFFYKRRAEKDATAITDVLIEQESLLTR